VQAWYVVLAGNAVHYDEVFANAYAYRTCGEHVSMDLRLPPSLDNRVVIDASLEIGEGEVPNPLILRCESDPVRLR
jgi:hypothetical protein